jgi:hypothetical protein
VLVTIVLAGIALPVIVEGVQLSLATGVHAGQKMEAASLAQAKMAEIIAMGDFSEAEMEGDFGEELPQYAWFSQLNEWDEDGRLLQLNVTVVWFRRGRDRHVTLSTLVDIGETDENTAE